MRVYFCLSVVACVANLTVNVKPHARVMRVHTAADRALSVVGLASFVDGNDYMSEHGTDDRLCCLPSHLFDHARQAHGFISAAGVFISWIAHDFFQEMLVRTSGASIPFTMVATEFFMCTVGAALQIFTSRGMCPKEKRQYHDTFAWDARTWSVVVLLALLLLGSLSLGNLALRWVSFPVKVVLKSSKLLPAMLIGVLILRKRYTGRDYLAAVLLCAGVVGVTFANSSLMASAPIDADASHQALGIALTCASVVFDAVSPVLQEMLLRDWGVPPPDLMHASNGLAFLGISAMWLWSREWQALGVFAASFDGGAPRLLLILMLYGLCSYFGIAFLLFLIRAWGSAIGVAVTTLRKIVTIAISFVAFPKECTWGFALSGLAVLASIAVAAHRPPRREAEGGS